MCKDFGIGIVKVVAMLTNGLFLIITGMLVINSVFTFKRLSSYSEVLTGGMQGLPLVGTVLSALVFVTIIFGFVGMSLNAFGMICFYITVMLILGVGMGLCCVYQMSEAAEMLRDPYYIQNRIDQTFNITQFDPKMGAINAMQEDLNCCGLILGKDQYKNESTKMPSTCCKDPFAKHCVGEDIWQDNCISKLEVYTISAFCEQATLMMCSAIHCFMCGGIGYVLAMAVRQYYYY